MYLLIYCRRKTVNNIRDMGTENDVDPLDIQDTLNGEAEEVSIYARTFSPLAVFVQFVNKLGVGFCSYLSCCKHVSIPKPLRHHHYHYTNGYNSIPCFWLENKALGSIPMWIILGCDYSLTTRDS